MTTTIDRLTVDTARMVMLDHTTEPYVVVYQGRCAVQCTQIDSMGDMWHIEVSRNQDSIWRTEPWTFMGTVNRETALVLLNHYLNEER